MLLLPEKDQQENPYGRSQKSHRRTDSSVGEAGACVDTNLLLLLFADYYDGNLISPARRTYRFAPEDCETLSDYVTCFQRRALANSALRTLSGDGAASKECPHEQDMCAVREGFPRFGPGMGSCRGGAAQRLNSWGLIPA